MRDLASLGISPAPWKFHKANDMPFYWVDGVASTVCGEHMEADARLIASAPMLYEALRGLLEEICDECNRDWYGDSMQKCIGCQRMKAARAALAAASGEGEEGETK